MNKQKNDQQLISNRTIQMLIIFSIIAIVFTKLNLWAIWWIPFLVMSVGGGCGVYYHDEKQKHKNDDYDAEYI